MCVFSGSLSFAEKMENIRQRKGEAELAQVNWLLQLHSDLPPGSAVALAFSVQGTSMLCLCTYLHSFYIGHEKMIGLL